MQPQLFPQNSRFKSLKMLFFSAFIWATPNQVNAITIVNQWQPIFQGIDYATGFIDEPVFQKVNGLRIDLSNPNIRFLSTPSNGAEPEETSAQTTSQFLDEFNLQVAINANFFAPCCNPASEPKDVIGLALSRSQIVSPADGAVFGGTGEVPESLLISQVNEVEIFTANSLTDLSEILTAVSGSPRLLEDGQIVVSVNPPNDFANLNPRTAVGLSLNEQYLILMTIDGRQPGISEGATLYQTAQWLLRFGAFQGLNLDGGGSTTMVREGQLGNPQLLNIPSGSGRERFNGNNFGVFALSIPEPGTLWLVASFCLCLAWLRPVR